MEGGVRWEERESEGQEEVSVHVFGGGEDEGEENANMSTKIGPYKNTRCH